MKTLIVDVLIFHPEYPDETRVEVRSPVPETTARRLLKAQAEGSIVTETNILYALAGAIGDLNGRRGIPLRVREVEE